MPFKLSTVYGKVKRKAAGVFYDVINNTPFQFCAFKSYWNYRLHKADKENTAPKSVTLQYLAERPNYGAGIGHQLANWNAAYYFSHYYHLGFAHFPFSNENWDYILGMGEQEMTAAALLKDKQFKKIRLPRFNSQNENEVNLIGKIIHSYNNRKVLFLLAQDQGYMRQCDTCADLSQKFFAAPARKEDKLFYKTSRFNIAIHIRRGDIVDMKNKGDAQWEQRWLTNNYYATVLTEVLASIKTDKQTDIYIFSQGTRDDFPEFSQFSDINYCNDVNACNSFVHMIHADVLISSKSSFSYKPALMSRGIKICPADFWHAYPTTADFILADNSGHFDRKQLANVLDERKV